MGWIVDCVNVLIVVGFDGVVCECFVDVDWDVFIGYDFWDVYVCDFLFIIDFDVICEVGVCIGVDLFGGVFVEYWVLIVEMYDFDFDVVNFEVDFIWWFMILDWDEKIWMDLFLLLVMVLFVVKKGLYDVFIGNDVDVDCYGIVILDVGLMNLNYYFVVVIDYLFLYCEQWLSDVVVGKILVLFMIIDCVVELLGCCLLEVLVGFKWFVFGLFDGFVVFGGEEFVGVFFFCRDGFVWFIDKDGILLCLLVVEIIVVIGKMLLQCYVELEQEFGVFVYQCVDVFVILEQKVMFVRFVLEFVIVIIFVGEEIIVKFLYVFGNDVVIGGFKVQIEYVWFVVCFLGMEDVYKFYVESLCGLDYFVEVQVEVCVVVLVVFGG